MTINFDTCELVPLEEDVVHRAVSACSVAQPHARGFFRTRVVVHHVPVAIGNGSRYDLWVYTGSGLRARCAGQLIVKVDSSGTEVAWFPRGLHTDGAGKMLHPQRHFAHRSPELLAEYLAHVSCELKAMLTEEHPDPAVAELEPF